MRPLLLVLLFLHIAPALHAQSFQGLGDLPGGSFASFANDVSADGAVVVGSGENIEGDEAFRWTRTGGMEGLGSLPSGLSTRFASGVSADGSVIVGAAGSEAFRWTVEGGPEGLGDLPGGNVFSTATGVSADGGTVVGASTGEAGQEAFRWTMDGGMEGLGDLPGGNFSSAAEGVSAEGTVVVGNSSSSNGAEAFRWANGVMQGLGFVPGGFSSTATAASVDGAVVVGHSNVGTGLEAFRWTESGEMEGLGHLPGEDISAASDVSADGAVIVGYSGVPSDPAAFLWTEEDGMRALKTILEEEYALDLTGWRLSRATGVSDDGAVIVGTGINPEGNTEAWRAEIPLLATWLDPVSGFFNEPTRWSINDIPTETHVVLFDAPTASAYDVTFVQDQTTRALTIDSSQVSFDLGGAAYMLTETESDALRVGLAEGRPAVLTLFGGGTLAATDAALGEEEGSSGALGVGLGTPATLALDGLLTVADGGEGALDVDDGGTVTVRQGLRVGADEGGTGSVTVADGLLQVTEGALGTLVGLSGTGTLDVIGGTLSLTGFVNVGSAPAGNGTLALSAGASGATLGALQVGVAGIGGLEVTGGAALTSNEVTLGLQPGSFGTALVEGAGSRWEVGGPMRVGDQGAALVQLQDGATFCVDTFDYHIGSQGTVQVVGSVVISEVTTCPAALSRRSAAPAARSGGAVLVTPALFLADGAELEAEALVLEGGGTLGGGGTLALPVTNTGRLAPGDSAEAVGTFTVEGDYEQTADGTLAVELQGLTPGEGHDVLAVTGTATLGGALQVTLLDDFEPAVGDVFTVVTADAVGGSFKTVDAPTGYAFAVAYESGQVVLTLQSVSNEDDALPLASALHAPYPNPTAGTATLAFDLAEAGPVRLAVYDVLGREVAVLVEAERPAGRHETVLDGASLPSGVYFIRIEASGFRATQKLVHVR